MFGPGKEFVGNVVRKDNLKNESRCQNEESQSPEATGQIKDYVGVAVDHVTSTIGSAVAGITGDRQTQCMLTQAKNRR